MTQIKFGKYSRYLLAGFLVFALSSVLCASDCYAVFESLTGAGSTIFVGMRRIIFASAGFGIIAIAIGAIFGSLNWKWLAAIIIGIVVIAATGALVSYLTMGTGADVTVKGITNTLTTGAEAEDY